MSRRMPPPPPKGPELRLETNRPPSRPITLEPAEIDQLRRSIRVVRCMVARRVADLKGMDAMDAQGQPIDPLDRRAVRFSLPGAFLLASSRSESLHYIQLLRLSNAAASDMLDNPSASVFDYSDDPEIDQDGLFALLDEVNARLDGLSIRH